MNWYPTVIDHLFILVFAVIYPLAGFFGYRRLLREIARGVQPDRPRLYRSILVGHWLLMLVAVLIWMVFGRSPSSLGFSFDATNGFWISAAIGLAIVGLMWWQLKNAEAADQEERDGLEAAFGSMALFMPRTSRELRRFDAVSVTAGVVEEVLWRAVLIAYLATYMQPWMAAAASAIGFGLAHAYQGWKHVPRIVIVGSVFVILFLLSGSIWIPLVVHAAVDMLQGRLALEVLTRPGVQGYRTGLDAE